MSTQHLTLEDIIIELRLKLLEVIRTGDHSQLSYLGYAFAIIEEAAIAKNDAKVAYIAMHLYEAVRDTTEGETWKSTIPTIEQIREAFLSSDTDQLL